MFGLLIGSWTVNHVLCNNLLTYVLTQLWRVKTGTFTDTCTYTNQSHFFCVTKGGGEIMMWFTFLDTDSTPNRDGGTIDILELMFPVLKRLETKGKEILLIQLNTIESRGRYRKVLK